MLWLLHFLPIVEVHADVSHVIQSYVTDNVSLFVMYWQLQFPIVSFQKVGQKVKKHFSYNTAPLSYKVFPHISAFCAWKKTCLQFY